MAGGHTTAPHPYGAMSKPVGSSKTGHSNGKTVADEIVSANKRRVDYHGAAGDNDKDDTAALNETDTAAAGGEIVFNSGKTYYLAGSRPRLMDLAGKLVFEAGAKVRSALNPGIKEFSLYSPAEFETVGGNSRVFEQNRNVPVSLVQAGVAAANLNEYEFTELDLSADFEHENVAGRNGYIAGSATVTSTQATWSAEVASGQEGFWRDPIVGDHIEIVCEHNSSVAQLGYASVDIVGDAARYAVTIKESGDSVVVLDNAGAKLETIDTPTTNYGIRPEGSVAIGYRVISDYKVEIYVNDWLAYTLDITAPGSGTASTVIERVGFTLSRQLTDVGRVFYPVKWTKYTPRNSAASRDAVLGDSISYGAYASKDYAHHLEQMLAQMPGGGEVSIDNYAIPGASTATWVAGGTYTGFGNTINYSLAGLDFTGCQFVYVMLGTNDCQGGIGLPTFVAKLGAIADKIETDGAIPIFGVPPVWDPATGSNSQNIAVYGAEIRKFCKARGLQIAEVRGWMGANTKRYFDGIHPHEVGQVAIAGAFAEARKAVAASRTTEAIIAGASQNVVMSGEPALTNGWENYGGAYQNAKYDLKAGRVYLSGLIKNGTVGVGVVAFTLPSGCRPEKDQMFSAISYNGVTHRVANVVVAASGNVSVWAGSNDFLSLSGISFEAA